VKSAREVIAEQLRRDYESEYSTDEPVSAWFPQSEAILRELLSAGYKVVPLTRETLTRLGK
jgi:hypothetical protein